MFVQLLLQFSTKDEGTSYWRSRENPLSFNYGMKGQYLLPLCTQTVFQLERTSPKRKRFPELSSVFHKRPIELAEACDT